MKCENTHVLIIGGGYGGLLLAHKIKSNHVCKVTLVDPKDSMVHYVAALRSSVMPDYAEKMFIPYQKVLGDSFVRGKVETVNLENKEVKLSNGNKISFTKLVIAVGGSSPFPGKIISRNEKCSKEDGCKIYSDFFKQIEVSKDVLIVGGGAVGIEMAGEIRNEFSQKNITVINSRSYVVTNRCSEEFQTKVNQALSDRKIKLILEDKVINMDELKLNTCEKSQIAKTEKGLELEVDLIIPCIGNTLNTQFLQPVLGSSISKNGIISVNSKLKVAGFDSVYAIGDVNDINEEKMAYTAKLHANLVFNNMVNEIEGSPLSDYVTGNPVMVLPLGRNGGVTFWNGQVQGDEVTKQFKSEGLFTAQTWSDLGLSVPE